MSDLDLANTPALQPPAGEISNLIDPVDRGTTYIVVASVFLAIATLFVGVRLWARFIIQRSQWWDDLACVVALLCQGAYCGVCIWLCLHGVGRHLWNVSYLNFISIIQPARAMANVTEPAIGFTKLALLLFYYRLFTPNKMTKIGAIVGMVFIVTAYTALELCFIFTTFEAAYLVNDAMAVINVVSDFYILILPFPAVLQLHLPRGKKIGLAALFSTGLFACIMSIVGAIYRFRFSETQDFTWVLLDVILVNTIECTVGITCACLPLFPVIRKSLPANGFLSSLRSLSSRIFSRSNRSRSYDIGLGDEEQGAGSMELAPGKPAWENGSARNLVRNSAGPQHAGLETVTTVSSMPGLYDDERAHGREDFSTSPRRPQEQIHIKRDFNVEG